MVNDKYNYIVPKDVDTAITDHHDASSDDHDDRYYTETEIDSSYGSLIDNSIADTLHRHSELVASDGSPDPIISVDDAGNVGVRTENPGNEWHLVNTGTVYAEIQTTDADSGIAGIILNGYRTADNDLAQIVFQNNDVNIAGIWAYRKDENNSGELSFRVVNAGSESEAMRIDKNKTITAVSLTTSGILVGSHDDITADSAGVAASITTETTFVTTDGDSNLDDVTLADGTEGQIKYICCVAEGNAADTWKITPANMIGGNQITFNGVGEGCILKMYSTGWVVVGNNGGTIS